METRDGLDLNGHGKHLVRECSCCCWGIFHCPLWHRRGRIPKQHVLARRTSKAEPIMQTSQREGWWRCTTRERVGFIHNHGNYTTGRRTPSVHNSGCGGWKRPADKVGGKEGSGALPNGWSLALNTSTPSAAGTLVGSPKLNIAPPPLPTTTTTTPNTRVSNSASP